MVTGKELLKLLLAEGWEKVRRSRHGWWLEKFVDGRTRHTVVKPTRTPVPWGTLNKILSPQQTGLDMAWLRAKLGRR